MHYASQHQSIRRTQDIGSIPSVRILQRHKRGIEIEIFPSLKVMLKMPCSTLFRCFVTVFHWQKAFVQKHIGFAIWPRRTHRSVFFRTFLRTRIRIVFRWRCATDDDNTSYLTQEYQICKNQNRSKCSQMPSPLRCAFCDRTWCEGSFWDTHKIDLPIVNTIREPIFAIFRNESCLLAGFLVLWNCC